jgi:hypothetical protein
LAGTTPTQTGQSGQIFTGTPVRHRNDNRPAILYEGDVAEIAAVNNRPDCCPVVPTPFGDAPDLIVVGHGISFGGSYGFITGIHTSAFSVRALRGAQLLAMAIDPRLKKRTAFSSQPSNSATRPIARSGSFPHVNMSIAI